MKEKDFDFKKVPAGYQLCFHYQCPMHEHCMHFVAGQHVTADRPFGLAIFPSALQDGKCMFFREFGIQQMAWGFSNLYVNVPPHLRGTARKKVQACLGGGCSTYYRFHQGERLLSPKMQQNVLDTIARYGSTEGIRFDHYVTEYDFT